MQNKEIIDTNLIYLHILTRAIFVIRNFNLFSELMNYDNVSIP